MKRFWDKTWAKLAAFFLTLVFGALTALGVAGVAVLAGYEAFLDGGAYLRESLYQSACCDAISDADFYLRNALINAGVLADDVAVFEDAYDGGTDTTADTDISAEAQAQMLADLPRLFAEGFSREASACHLTVSDGGAGELNFENFTLTNGDTPLYATQENLVYTLADGGTITVTISAELLRTENAPSYTYLLLEWLLNHTGLTVALTALCLALTLFCFGFLMASCGHWQGKAGIHLTWFDRLPIDVLLLVLAVPLCFFWDEGYFGYLPGAWLLIALLAVFSLLFLCALAAQCKAGTVVRGSLIARLCRLVWRIVRMAALSVYRIAVRLPLIWKTALAGLALALTEFYLFTHSYWGRADAEFLILKLVELLAVLYVAVNLRVLQKGGENLAGGDFSSPIDTRYLIGDFKRYGRRMNELRSGMERAVQEQTKAERMKTELITNVSHDIKTPLTSIVNYVDLLQKIDVQPETAREYIAVLDRQSRRLKKLTEDLVEASKASSGALPVELQVTDVAVLFEQIIGEYQERLADCRLTLVAKPPEQPLSVYADGKLLSRVMDNLVSNVCKYALADTRVYAVASFDEQSVTISFKNVSRAELNVSPDELMERFVRGDASRHTEGSGLGLSIAGSLVRLMGGTFRLSIDGDLFRADITLPRA